MMSSRSQLGHYALGRREGRTPRQDGGQILVLAVGAMVFILAMAALLLEGGNAYAQQRSVQNGADAAANAGALALAGLLAGATPSNPDAEVAAAISTVSVSTANNLNDPVAAYYTNIKGEPLDVSGYVVSAGQAAVVGGGTIPPGARGVHVTGTRSFPTAFGRVIGFNEFTASAPATAVTGRVVGGPFLPVVFPISISDCSTSGNLTQPVSMTDWATGPEYIVPLCKTGGGSFQILDWDNVGNSCLEDVVNPPPVTLDLPMDVPSDVGNNCGHLMVDAVNTLHGQVVLIPICDSASGSGGCGTGGGTNATYHITQVAAFMIDYMADSNNANQIDALCQAHTSGTGDLINPIAGNGSSSCIAGWFVKFYPPDSVVDGGEIGNLTPIGVQLIQ